MTTTPYLDLNQFKRDGYALIPGFFREESDIRATLRQVKDVFRSVIIHEGLATSDYLSDIELEQSMKLLFLNNLEKFIGCGKTSQNVLDLFRLGLMPQVVQFLKKLGLKSPAFSTRPVLFFNHPDLAKREVYYKTPPHQDWRSIQGSLNSVVMWVPLCNISGDMGPLEVIPGSHLRGLQATKVKDNFGLCENVSEDEFVSVQTSPGDALFFSTFLIHRSGENTSEKIRWSCHFRYNDLTEATYLSRGHPSPYRYFPEEKLITPGFPTQFQIEEIFKLSDDT